MWPSSLVYLPEPGRRRFVELMAELPAVRVWAEGPGVVPDLDARLGRAPISDGAVFLLGWTAAGAVLLQQGWEW